MKSFKKTLVLLILLFTVTFSQAQLSSYNFDGERKIKFSLRYGKVTTTGVSLDSVINPKAILFRSLELDKIDMTSGGYNVSHRFAFLFETTLPQYSMH